MCFLGGAKAPPPVSIPQAPPAPAAAPQGNDQAVVNAQQKQKLAALKAKQENNTLVTGGQGLTAPAQTAGKQLYGQ